MVKTTEGVIITSSQCGNGSQLPNKSVTHLPEVDADLNSLPRITRQLFVDDVQKAVSDVEENNLPPSVMPVLQALLDAAHSYVLEGNETSFMAHCDKAIDTCNQGWNYMSYWASTEQNTCYSVYWALRAAVEKHQKQMTMYLGSKNDGLPKNDADPPFSSEPKLAFIKKRFKERNMDVSAVNHSLIKSKLLSILSKKSFFAQETIIKQYTDRKRGSYDQCARIQYHKSSLLNKNNNSQEN